METLQGLGKAGVGDPEERVVVGAHHHVGGEGEVELLTGGSQPLEEVLAVPSVTNRWRVSLP